MMHVALPRFARFFTLFLCLFVLKAQSQSNVLIVAASTYTSDVQAKLNATGLFGKVDVFDANSGTPSLATLSGYQSVLVFSDEGFYNSTTLGNNLASYANAGGGVVTATFTFYPNSAYYVGGNFATTYQVIIPANGFTAGSTQTLGTVFYPNNPTIKGITNFNGGTSSYRNTSTSLTLGSYVVANWNDGLPLVVVKNNVGPANVNRVDLNFYPPSSDIRSDFWVSSTQGASLMAKALQYVSSAAAPTISSFTPTTASSGTTVTITGTNLTSATAVSFGGTAATSFSVVNSTTVTAVVGSGTSGNVSVTAPGGTTNLAGFTYCTNVTPSVSVVASPSGIICSGTNVTFTATPTNGGSAPTYQWQKNGVTIATATSSTFTCVPANGDVISCTITANNTCQTTATATNSITETVNPSPTAAVLSGTAAICNGSSSNLSVAITGGTSPFTIVYSGGTLAGYTSGSNISVSPSTTTSYSLNSVTDAKGCTVTSPNGTPTVTIKLPTTSTTTAAICYGSSYTFNGTTYTTGGTYVAHLTNAVGCDSAATLILTVKSLSSSTTTAAICSGSSYTFNGVTYTNGGTYVAHLTNAVGCDSAATLILTVKSLSTSTTTAAICSGSSYTFNGTTYTNGGTYVAHLTNAVGCDSAATLILTVKSLSTSTTTASICSGGSYTFNGATYTTSGTYVAHLTNAVGCDSATTLVLTVKSLSTSTTTAAICSGSSYTFNGATYTTSGTYVAHLTNAVGCDSATTLVLTVKATSTSTTNLSICSSSLPYSWNGYSLTSAGSYRVHLTNSVGCDSSAILVLTVKALSTSTTNASICSGGSYTFNGTTYTNGGTYVAHLTNAVGCDSAATLVLTVKSLSTSTTTAAICSGSSYTFNGTTHTTSGTYVAHLTNSVGCDSAATLVLTVKSLSTSTTTASICSGSSYTFNGTTYTNGGTYVAHLTNAVGCDSAATLVLTVKSLSTSTTTAAICSGSSYTFNGTTYTSGGTFVAHLTNAVGCDSAATLILTVKSLSTSKTTICICAGSSYTFNGVTYSTAGTYVAHLTNSVGCDSAATLVLKTKATSTSTTTAAICSGSSYTFNGTTHTTSGTYVAHLTNSVGCDSAATLVLTVNALPTTSIAGTSSFCVGTNTLLTDNATAGSGNIACYKWYLNGAAISGAKASTYTATTAGNYTVAVVNTNGCSVTSSAFAVAVNPLPTPTISGPTYGCGTVSYTVTGGVSYLWNNGSTPTTVTNTFTTATSYGVSVTATNANGCTATATQTIPANTAPIITSVATQNTLVGTSVSPTVTVGDLETPNSLTITACSNNATLVPKANITVTGSGATRTITVTPAQYQIGTATITVKVIDCGGLTTTTSFNVNVTVPNYTTGTANFAIVKTVSLIDNCSDSIYFVNESYNGAGATYQWYINGYYTTQPSFLNSTGGLIGYKNALPGTYTALLVVTDAVHQTTYQSSQTFTFTRGVVPVPSPSFTVGSVVANGSGTATVLLNSTTPYVQGGVINAWTITPMTNVAAFNTASSSPTLSITQTSAAQTFNASLTVTPTNGCKSYTTAVQPINVPAYSPIVPSFTVGVTKSKVDACNDSVYIVNNTTGGVGGNTYTWYFGDSSAAYVTTSTATIGRIYIHPNTYNILLVVTDKSGQTASKTVAVTTIGTVPPVIANAIIYGPYYTPTASTVTLDGGNSSTAYGSLNYLWTLTPTGGSATTYTATNVPLTINRTNVNQNYTAVLTVKDAIIGCRISTVTKTFTVNQLPVGTNYVATNAEMTEETKNIVSVYPNPARSTVNVKIMLASASDNVDIKVFNSMGKAVIENHQSIGNTKQLTTNMSVANLAAGLYYIKVYNQAGALIGSSTIVKQ